MIFKTFDSDIDNMSSRWGMFGKSFSDIGNTITTKWKQVTDYIAVTNDATISGMMSAWKGTSPVQFLSDDSVVNVLNDYNKALDKGAEATAKFFETGTGNDFMNGWLKQLKGAPATMDDYKAAVTKAELAQNGLTTSMVASKVAALALNVAVSMGVSIAISALIKLVDNLVHANEKAIEKAEELRDKYNDFKETNASNVKTLNDLKDEFEELSDGVSQYGDNISLTTEQYARYQEIVQQIVGISPSLAEGYDTENGYIADKNGLLERAIELQEIEYKNELRKITNLDNLKTSMSGYIAEYKEALNGGYVTSEGNIIGTTIDTDFKNSLWEVFNTNNRDNYDGQSMAKDIMESLGVKDIDKEIEKYINEYGYWQDSDFWNDYCDKIVSNLDVVTNSLTAEEVGLDDTIFEQNIEKLESYAEQYSDMKDSVKSANESIQTDLGYIAEYADGYSDLSKEQQKFVTDYLKGFDISDITSENSMGILEYDEDKMASVKSQIKKFVEELSHDDSTKQALTDLYAPPSDNETIEEYKNRIDSALEVIRKYCETNGIEIPVGISNVEDSATGLESSYKQTIENAKEKYGEDLTPFFKENSINTQEEIDKWREIAQSCDTATEAKKKYLETDTSQETTPSFSTLFDGSDFGDRISYLNQQFQNGKISAHDYFQSIRDELANTDFSEFTDQAAAAQQFFTDSTQQVASSMSDLINSYNKGEISATEYLDGYTSMAEALSALTDDLQNNSAAWNENGEAVSDGTNQALDNAQSDLASAIEGINQYQDSIYSLEQITSGAITAGSDEFTAHAQVIAEDLAYIVQNGGYMADQIASTMGTTTSEIANSLTNSVDNQALASQAIAGNTNASIEQMANAVSTLFTELGNQIGNFKATVNFAPKVNGVEHFSAIKIGGKEVVGGDIPNLTYDIKGSSSSLKSIGSAISSFGKVLSSNISAQKVDYKKFSTTPTDSSGKERSYTPSKGVTNNYNNKLKNNKSSGKSGSGSGGKNSGSDAEKQNEEYLDKFMAYQKARLEAGKITYQQYSQYVSDELERMYKNGEISASKYYSAVKDMIDEQKSIYDAALKGVTKLLDDEVQKWQDKIDAIEKTNDKLNEQKDKYDSILSAIQKVYDDEIEDANKRKDSIQDVIDAMSDENDEYERQKKLQEAIYNLNKANSQKTKYLLKDGQFVYSTDNSAIRDAQDSLHDAQYDVDVANLKKQQDDIDNYIDTLNEFKDKWSEISDAFSEAQDTMNLKQYLGSEYQRIILSNNLADIENFKNQYVAVESQINSNEQLKTSYEEKVNYYNNLKQQWADCTSKYDDEMNKLYASQVLGANWESEVLSGRLQTLTNFTSEYEKLCQRRADAAVNAANVEVQASKNAAAGVASASSSVASSGGGSSSGGNSSSTSSTPKVTYDKNNNPNKPKLVSKDYWTYEKLSSGYSTSGQASSHISDYASKGANGFTQIGNKYFVVKWIANAGTPANASKAKNKLEKDHPKKIGKYGYAKRYHKGLELGKIDALPKDKAFDLVQDVGINGLKSDEVPIIAQKREAVLTEEQIENLAKTLHLVPVQNEIMEKMSKINLGDLPMNTPKMNFDVSKIGQNVTRNNFAPNVTLNLNCPNVSSVSDAKAITEVVDKQLNKFANDFYQASLHYVNKK